MTSSSKMAVYTPKKHCPDHFLLFLDNCVRNTGNLVIYASLLSKRFLVNVIKCHKDMWKRTFPPA